MNGQPNTGICTWRQWMSHVTTDNMPTTASLIDWIVFATGVTGAMLLDRFLGRASRGTPPFRIALERSTLWISVGLAQAVWIAYRFGPTSSITYVTSYLVEESLSIDNLFVFLVIFRHFHVKDAMQNRVLFWGVFGAIVLRGVFIVTGAELLHHFSATAYVFGAVLIVSGLKLLKKDKHYADPEHSFVFRLARKCLRATHEFEGDRFFIRRNGLYYATPLVLVLIAVEFTDIVFAVDSVPAVLAISQDMFIIYTSNILAVMGLRALFVMVAGMIERFHKLDLALSLVLVFIGLKMGLHRFVHIPNAISLGVVLGLITIGIALSLMLPPRPGGSIPDLE
jgi:tellurite resistance protein TerC